MLTAEILRPKNDLENMIKEYSSSQAKDEHKVKVPDTVIPMDWIAKGVISRTLKNMEIKTDAKLEELKSLKSFQSLMTKVKLDTKDKVEYLKNQMIFERDLHGNSPLELREGNVHSSPFGLNDSFQKLPNTGPGVTPTQMTKSQKDNISRSFDEVPSFNNPTKSHKSDIQASKPSMTADHKKDYHANNRSDMLNNPNLSFEDMKGKSGNNLINILDDSFGVKNPDIEIDNIPYAGNDSFGAQDNMFQEVSNPPTQDIRILDPLLNSSQPGLKNTSQGHVEKASLSKTIMAGFTPSSQSLNQETIPNYNKQSRMEDHDILYDNPVFGSQISQQSQMPALDEDNLGFAMPQEIHKNTSSGSYQNSFGHQEFSPSSRSPTQFGKSALPERETASITEEGTLI